MASFDDLLNNAPTEEQGAPQLSKEEYAAKKKAEREEVFELSDQTALEVSGDCERFRQYLDVQSTFGRYSAVNTLLILAQNPEATRLGSFDYWKEKNCSVRPGQMAIAILEPHEYTKDDDTPGTGYNIKKVFDISQVDARKLKTAPPLTYSERQLLQALITKAPIKITGVDELPGDLGAMTDPVTGGIFVRRGMEFADTFRSTAQELAYSEVDREDDTPGDPRFSAYCTAYILCKKYGVDTKDFSFEEVSGVFEGMDAQGVKHELSQIRDVVENVSRRMARQLEAQQKAAKSQEAR